MHTNAKVTIFIFLIFVVLVIPRMPTQQTIIPSCVEKEDCYFPVKDKYCGAEYDCVVGKCYQKDVTCPEKCYGGIDEDFDNLTDCADSDCYTKDLNCHCAKYGQDICLTAKCYCQTITRPTWTGDTCSCI